jgi:hypothetical protein
LRWAQRESREAFFGVRRFGQLVRNLNIPRRTLSSRLRMLVDADVIYSAPSSRSCDGATNTCPTPTGPPIVLRHNACGQIAGPGLTCTHCGDEITARSVTPEAGPGFSTVTEQRVCTLKY